MTTPNLKMLHDALIALGVAHVYVESRAKPIVRNVNIRFKTASERTRQRKLRKIWERRNKSKLELKRKRYETKMKHRKPNPILSKRAKKVALKYNHN